MQAGVGSSGGDGTIHRGSTVAQGTQRDRGRCCGRPGFTILPLSRLPPKFAMVQSQCPEARKARGSPLGAVHTGQSPPAQSRGSRKEKDRQGTSTHTVVHSNAGDTPDHSWTFKKLQDPTPTCLDMSLHLLH